MRHMLHRKVYQELLSTLGKNIVAVRKTLKTVKIFSKQERNSRNSKNIFTTKKKILTTVKKFSEQVNNSHIRQILLQ